MCHNLPDGIAKSASADSSPAGEGAENHCGSFDPISPKSREAGFIWTGSDGSEVKTGQTSVFDEELRARAEITSHFDACAGRPMKEVIAI